MSYAIYHNFVIKAPAAKVFDAIVEPSHLVNWWPQKCTGKPELGATYNLYFTDEYNWFGEVVKCDSNKAFHVKMTQADEDWTPTAFGFDLEEIKNGIQLHFWH